MNHTRESSWSAALAAGILHALIAGCSGDDAVATGATESGTDGTGTASESDGTTQGTATGTASTTMSGSGTMGSSTGTTTASTTNTSESTGPTTTNTTNTTSTTSTTSNTTAMTTTGDVDECMTDADCDALLGPAPCGAWACNQQNFACEAASPGCTDVDQDGYGAGANCTCAGLDCDDDDPDVADNAVLSCYSGPGGTEGVGACQAGAQSCVAGIVGPCVGEVTPAAAEACNDEDDDCDGQTDEDLGSFACGLGACAKTVAACQNGQVGVCVPSAGANVDGPMCNMVDDDCDGPVDEDCKVCVPVAPNGNDATADGTLGKPFQTIQAAINWTVLNKGPTNVCVAAGAQCGANATYKPANGQTITMADGISVLGRYESTNWTRCNNSTTVIQPQTAAGVTFPPAVKTTTVLDGFRVDRLQSSTTAGVTVDGAKGALLSDITISNTPSVTNSYGVDVKNAGEVTISRSRIDAGVGTTESIAVRVIGGRLTATDNCASVDANGRCDDFCANNPSFRGRTQSGPGTTYAVLLQDAPGSLIQRSALCANDADVGAVVRIRGTSDNIVFRGNLVNAFGGAQDSHGVWMEECGGAAPWIVDNHYIAAAGDTQQSRVDAIRAIGDCHPVIDSNRQITGGGEGQAANPNGVHCAANGNNLPSRCVVLGNRLIEGSDFGYPPIATGVRCDDGACLRIEGNTITGRGGVTTYGVFLDRTGSFVDGNFIRGGCAPTSTGIQSEDSYSRIQNNMVLGYLASECTGNPPAPMSSVGVRVLISSGGNEVDVHSNTIEAYGTATACTSRAIELGLTGMNPSGGVGIFRNNILRGGACNTSRIPFVEAIAAADPRIFENNLLDNTGAPSALYLDESTTSLMTAAQVDALADMIVAGTLAADAMLVAVPVDLHIQPASPAKDKGTQAGAPLTDYDGATRDMSPDIGADEL